MQYFDFYEHNAMFSTFIGFRDLLSLKVYLDTVYFAETEKLLPKAENTVDKDKN